MTDDSEKKEARSGRKERVLHTRVPAVLEQELKRVANAWRVPVSNVVRALLEDALDTIDVVGAKAEDELRGVAQKLASERHRIRRKSTEQLSRPSGGDADVRNTRTVAAATPIDPLDGAVGVTPITLVHDAECALTGRPLAAGSDAYLVLFDDPNRKLITGRDALPRASTSNEEKGDD